MFQKLHEYDFNLVENTSQCNEDFIKIYNENSDIRYFIEADIQYLEKLREPHNDLRSLSERMKNFKK